MTPSLDPSSIFRASMMGWSHMSAHFHDDLPNEAVGLLYENGLTVRLTNQARSPHRFSVGETQFHEAIMSVPSDLNLIGLYHSHPGDRRTFSETDYHVMASQFESGYPYCWVLVLRDSLRIAHVSLNDSEVKEFDIDPFQPQWAHELRGTYV